MPYVQRHKMGSTPQEKATHFRSLHVPGQPFILANAWDMGSARLLAGLGAKALATTSAGHAFTLGRPDMGHVSRDEALQHARILDQATPLPVNGDLENGYGHDNQDVVMTIQQAAEAGLAGCSIEDTKLPGIEAYDFNTAVERVEAAVDAVKNLEHEFVFTARADGIMNRQYDTAEAIRRLQAFEKAGADVLYAPLPPDMDALAEICRSVSKPVNAICAGKFTRYTLQDFANIGVARVSLGSALAAVTHKAIVDCAKTMFESGNMSLLGNTQRDNLIDLLLEEGTVEKK